MLKLCPSITAQMPDHAQCCMEGVSLWDDCCRLKKCSPDLARS